MLCLIHISDSVFLKHPDQHDIHRKDIVGAVRLDERPLSNPT